MKCCNWAGEHERHADPRELAHFRNAAIAAAASPLEQQLRGTMERERKAAKQQAAPSLRLRSSMANVISNQCIAMQSAVIEMELGEGAESAMSWVVNSLVGPGLYPDLAEAQELGGAQAWFDSKIAKEEALIAAAHAVSETLGAAGHPQSVHASQGAMSHG